MSTAHHDGDPGTTTATRPRTRPRTLIPRGPAGLTVRLHRRTLWAGLVLLLIAIGLLIHQRLNIGSALSDFTASGCDVYDERSACAQRVRDYWDAERAYLRLSQQLGFLLLLLPSALGGFVAGPVIARELESGTYRLAWTQSCSPARWLLAKITVPAVWAVTGTAVLAAFFRWSWSTGPHQVYELPWHDVYVYLALGPLLVGYVVLGSAVGALTGLLVRRTVPAMAVAAVVTGGVMCAFGAGIRGRLMPVTRVTGDVNRPDGSWVVEWGRTPLQDGSGGVTTYHEYQPSSHFWPLQLIETGILLALAALALHAAFRVLRRLHA
ncbi:ABC transporter permease [Streptomyces sp. NPDC012623]|uniref:ABC transporter permease n=1 Tax=unclassified Streptomyces TaxID=2593676 RepID=UPI0036CCA218